MRVVQSALFALMLSLSHAPGWAGDLPEDSPLHEAAAHWIDFFEAGDLEGLMTLYRDDVTVALHGQPRLQGKQAVREYFSSRINRWNSEFELEFERIEMGPDTAWLISKYWFTATDVDSGESFRDAGRSLLVYRLSPQGKWLIAADIDQATPDVDWPAPSKRTDVINTDSP